MQHIHAARYVAREDGVAHDTNLVHIQPLTSAMYAVMISARVHAILIILRY